MPLPLGEVIINIATIPNKDENLPLVGNFYRRLVDVSLFFSPDSRDCNAGHPVRDSL